MDEEFGPSYARTLAHDLVVDGLGDMLSIPGTYLHLYGKEETRTGRKMGHVSVLAADHKELDKAIGVVKEHCTVMPAKVEGSNQV